MIDNNTGDTGSGPSGPDPVVVGGIQRQAVYDLVRDCPQLNDLEVAAKLGIRPGPAATRLTELYDAGFLDRDKPPGADRLCYTVAPPERRNERTAGARRRQSLLKAAQKQPMAIQSWLINELLRPPQRRKDDPEFDTSVPCPEIVYGVGLGSCDCPNTNVYVARHERNNKGPGARRARSVLARWQKDKKEWEREAQEARNAADPRSIYLSDRNYVYNLREIVNFLAARTEDENTRRRINQGEIPDDDLQEWVDLLGEVAPAIERIKAAVAYVKGEDALDVDEVDVVEVRALPAGSYDDDDVVDAEVVDE